MREGAAHFERMRVLKVFEFQEEVRDFAWNDGSDSDVRLNERANVTKFAERHFLWNWPQEEFVNGSILNSQSRNRFHACAPPRRMRIEN